jgi:hypothetical protein
MEGIIERNLKNELKETIENNHYFFLFGSNQTGTANEIDIKYYCPAMVPGV